LNIMKLHTTSTLFLGSLISASAHPHLNQDTASHLRQTPSTTIGFEYLDKPMHTTALMAGEAWRLSTNAEAERTRSLEPVSTDRIKLEVQMDL